MKRFDNPIFVTRPYLPDLGEFKAGIDEIWNNQWLTNNGPMLKRFHSALADYLKVPETNMALFNNGTLALEMGFKAMGLFGAEVITTPFTFVATSHALKRIGAKPIFADIDPETMCLSPAAAEKLITPRTKAIVPVHVYGNVCDIEGFQRLSDKYGVKIIYDAAHAFGVKKCERCEKCERFRSATTTPDYNSAATIGAAGDMSMFSFHPTKLFHSCEGGLLVFKDPALQQKLFDLRNFAIHSETECIDVGTNAKMNELQALMGLCCLKKIDALLEYRQKIYEAYASIFNGPRSSSLTSGKDSPRIAPASQLASLGGYASPLSSVNALVKLLPWSANKAYVPVLFKDFETRERVYVELKEKCNVFSRRYFYPLLTDFAPYQYAKGTCPVAEDIARRVLTLPTYYGLDLDDVRDIAKNVLEMV